MKEIIKDKKATERQVLSAFNIKGKYCLIIQDDEITHIIDDLTTRVHPAINSKLIEFETLEELKKYLETTDLKIRKMEGEEWEQ
jgi:hypothetical protein